MTKGSKQQAANGQNAAGHILGTTGENKTALSN